MQLQETMRTVTPTVDGDLLSAVVRAGRPVTLREIVDAIGGRSYAGVRNAADRLVEQGVLLGGRVGRTKTFVLNTDHLAADAIVALARQREELLRRLRDGCAEIPLRLAALFGSGARGDMRSDSDLDLCFVVVDGRREAAEPLVHDLCDRVRRWTGNATHAVLFDEGDLDPQDELLASVAAEGVVIAGDGRWLARSLRTLAG